VSGLLGATAEASQLLERQLTEEWYKVAYSYTPWMQVYANDEFGFRAGDALEGLAILHSRVGRSLCGASYFDLVTDLHL
jgi:hypothetical protein